MKFKNTFFRKAPRSVVVICVVQAHFIFCMEPLQPQENPSLSLFNLVNQNSEDTLIEIKQLLQQGAHPDYVEPNSGQTALHKAVYFRKSDVLKLLLKKTKNVNVGEGGGKTPLHFAMITHMPTTISLSVQSNRSDLEHNSLVQKTLEIIALLLRYGADPCTKDLKEKTPINVADDNKNEKAKALCTNSLIYIQNIHKAIETQNKEEFNSWFLLPEAPIFNIDKKTGNSFLHEAALHEVIDKNNPPFFIKKLICSGIDINQKNNLGETALYIASKQKKKLMVLHLLFCCRGIDLALTDNNNSNCLPIWISNGWINLLIALIRSGYELQKKQITREYFEQSPQGN